LGVRYWGLGIRKRKKEEKFLLDEFDFLLLLRFSGKALAFWETYKSPNTLLSPSTGPLPLINLIFMSGRGMFLVYL